jgi:uncharacterized protein
VPSERAAKVATESISWNYTTVLNIAFLLLAVLFLTRFFGTGGREMLSMMNGSPPDDMNDHAENARDAQHGGHH